VLRKIFGSRRDEVKGDWRRVNYEELHDLCSSPNIRATKSRRMKWAGHVARTEERRCAYRILAGKPLGKKTLGIPRRRWKHNIKMDLQEIGWGDRLD
jgi:hypothetical protein